MTNWLVSTTHLDVEPGSHIERRMCTGSPIPSESSIRSTVSRDATSPRLPSVSATQSLSPDTSSCRSSTGLNETVTTSKPTEVLLVLRSAVRSVGSPPGSEKSTCCASSRWILSLSARASTFLLALSSERTTAPVESSERSSRACGLSFFCLRSKEPARSAWRGATRSLMLVAVLVGLKRFSAPGSASPGVRRCHTSSSHWYVEKTVSTKPASASVRSSSMRCASLTLSRPPCLARACSPSAAASAARGEAATGTGAGAASTASPAARGVGTYRRGASAVQWRPRAAPAPAPQSQKKRERREYETMWPRWHTLTQMVQQPSDWVRPQV